jgi:hypothetical protein
MTETIMYEKVGILGKAMAKVHAGKSGSAAKMARLAGSGSRRRVRNSSTVASVHERKYGLAPGSPSAADLGGNGLIDSA